jgi:hypothetical protein
MRKKYITLLVALLATTCAASSFIRIRLQRGEDNSTVMMLQDRQASREKIERIMDKLAAIDSRQLIFVQITEDVPTSDFLSVILMLQTKGLTNVCVYPLDGILPGDGTTNRLSFSLVLPEASTLEEFEGPLELLEDIPELRMNGEQQPELYRCPGGTPES